LYIQELQAGTELQQLQTDVSAVFGEGRSLIDMSPVGVDTSDIELTVDGVSRLLADINQQVMRAGTAQTCTQFLCFHHLTLLVKALCFRDVHAPHLFVCLFVRTYLVGAGPCGRLPCGRFQFISIYLLFSGKIKVIYHDLLTIFHNHTWKFTVINSYTMISHELLEQSG